MVLRMNRGIWKGAVITFFIIAVVLGFFGVMYLLASPVQQTQIRLMIGSLLIVVALVFVGSGIYVLRSKVSYTVKTTLELPAEFDLSNLRCEQCGSPLSKESITYQPESGALYINCPYCKSEYVMQEEPKW